MFGWLKFCSVGWLVGLFGWFCGLDGFFCLLVWVVCSLLVCLFVWLVGSPSVSFRLFFFKISSLINCFSTTDQLFTMSLISIVTLLVFVSVLLASN